LRLDSVEHALEGLVQPVEAGDPAAARVVAGYVRCGVEQLFVYCDQGKGLSGVAGVRS
jgi:hypothetical protein